MRFHSSCHGNNIIISEDGARASRSKSYYNGITFSAKPQASGQLITLELLDENKSWNGTLRYGLTNSNPVDIQPLPPFSIPDLTSKLGTWAKPLSEHHQNVGSRIAFSFTNDGSLSLYLDEECVETHDLCGAIDVTEPVWALIDVYGSITSVRLISLEADGIPVDILARGIKSQEAYKEAVTIGTKKVYQTRLMVVGQTQVGKTSLKKTLIGDSFNAEEKITCGIETTNVCEIGGETKGWKVCGRKNGGHAKIRDEYIEALSDYMVKILTPANMTDQENIDVTPDGSVQKASEGPTSSPSNEHDDVVERLMQQSHHLIGAVGATGQESNVTSELSYHSLPDEIVEQVEKRLIKQRKKAKNLPKEERKVAMTTEDEEVGMVMNIWDFAGQDMYTTHQVFLTGRAVYIVGFDLRHNLNKAYSSVKTEQADKHMMNAGVSSIDCLDFWLRTIYTYTPSNKPCSGRIKHRSPPIFIVGTHRDALDGDTEKQLKLVEEKFAIIRDHLKDKPYRQHVVNPFHAIENNIADSQDETVVALHEHIEAVLREESYMGKEMPLRWMLFENAIKKAVDKGIHFMTLEQIKELTVSLGLDYANDLFPMLQFYHDLGHIIYFGGETDTNEALKDLIILDPKWLIDVFNQVITVKDVAEQWPVYMDAWTRLDNEGVLEERLIDHMWNHIINQKPALLELMTKFGLICPLTKSNESNPTSYYVPSCTHPNHDTPGSHNQSAVVFYIQFDGFLPDGIFHRLIAQAVRWSQDQGGCMPNLHHRHASLYADDLHQIELQMSPTQQTKIMVVVTRAKVVKTSKENDDANDTTEDVKASPQMCNKVKIFLSTAMDELKMTWVKPISYGFCLDCPCGTGVPHMLDLDECLTKDIIMCTARHRIDTAGIRQMFHGLEASSSTGMPSMGPDSGYTTSASSNSSSLTSVGSENMLPTVMDSDIKIKQRLGGGGFGEVFLATHKHWGDIAVKQLRFPVDIAAEARQMWKTEVRQMWRTITSPSLIRIMGIIEDPRTPSIVMEYCKHGSLKSFLEVMVRSEVMPRKVKMILDIAMGMNHLHTLPSPIVHRDLKCDNVFVGEGFKAKIGDMGLAINMTSIQSLDKSGSAGTPSHMPPEALEGTITKPTTHWDVYTFGITLYEIYTNGRDPWPQLNQFANITLLRGWLQQGKRPDLNEIPDDSVPTDLIDIMKRCWDGDPNKRPTFQVLQTELSTMYSTQYEHDEYKADMTIMDAITQRKKEEMALKEQSTSSDTDSFWNQ